MKVLKITVIVLIVASICVMDNKFTLGKGNFVMTINNYYKIADHLEEAAKDLVSYVLKQHKTTTEQNAHIAQLASIMKDIEDRFNEPLLSWWSNLYRFYRQHFLELAPARKLYASLQEQYLILDVITDYLQKTSCHTDVSNTALIELLIKKVDKYQALECDERFATIPMPAREAAILGIKLVLGNLFIQHAKSASENFRRRTSLHFKIVR